MTQENNQQEYMLPQDVDYTKSFQFHCNENLYSYDPTQSVWHNLDSGAYGKLLVDHLKGSIALGSFKVLKEKQEDLFGTQFQFKCGSFPYVYLYNKQRYKVVGEDRWYGIDEDCARKAVANGHWLVLPSTPKQPTNTPKQFDEESLKAAEQIVSEALRPAVEAATLHFVNGSVWEFKEPTNWYEFFYDEPADNVLDIIKQACTVSSGRIVVQVTKDGYEVFHHYFYVDSAKVEESKLKDFLDALCLVDGMDSWSDV